MSERVEFFDSIDAMTEPSFSEAGDDAMIGGTIARANVLSYKGRVRYIAPYELFSPSTMAAFRGLAVTLYHPPQYLDSETTPAYSKGTILSVSRVEDSLCAVMKFTNPALVQALKDRTAPTALSVGWTCTVDSTPGVTPEGTPYKEKWENLVPNHVSLVDKALGGVECKLKLDSAQSTKHARFDFSVTLSRPRFLDSGWAVIPGTIARAGVLQYGPKAEYTPRELLFSSEVIKALSGLPITRQHPDRLLDSHSVKAHQIGSIKGAQRRSPDSPYLDAELLITDAATVQALRDGTAPTALSLGYSCELDETPGTTPEGEYFDAKRLTLDPNHVALCDRARGGDACKLRMDSANVEQTQNETPKKEETMRTIRLDGQDVEVSDAAAAWIDKAQGTIAALNKQVAAEKTKAANAVRMDAEQARSEARARLQLEEVARKHAPRMDAATIERADDLSLIVATLHGLGHRDTEGKSRDFLMGSLNVALNEHGSKALHQARAFIAVRQDGPSQPAMSIEEIATAKAKHEIQNRWRTSPEQRADMDQELYNVVPIRKDSLTAQLQANANAQRNDDNDGLLEDGRKDRRFFDNIGDEEKRAMIKADAERVTLSRKVNFDE